MSEIDIIEALDSCSGESPDMSADFEEEPNTVDCLNNDEDDEDEGGSSDGDVDNWVGGKGDKGGDGGGRVIDYAEDAVMLQMEDDEIEAEAAEEQDESSGPSNTGNIPLNNWH